MIREGLHNFPFYDLSIVRVAFHSKIALKPLGICFDFVKVNSRSFDKILHVKVEF